MPGARKQYDILRNRHTELTRWHLAQTSGEQVLHLDEGRFHFKACADTSRLSVAVLVLAWVLFKNTNLVSF